MSAAKALRHSARKVLAAALFASAIACPAADAPAPAAGVDAPAFSTELVKPGLYRIGGGGGTTLLRVSPDGLIVVDSKRPGMVGPLMAEIQRVAKSSNPPVRALILTGAGREQAGNAAGFVDAGVPLIVHKRALARLHGVAPGSGGPRPAVVTYDTDYRLVSGGVVVEVEHVGSGRSGADSIVLFPDLRVVAVGELFTTETPEPDCADGGSFAGWAAAIAHLLWSDFDIAVPSRGPPVGKRELLALKAKLEALAERRGAAPDQTACGVAGMPR